MPRIKKRPDGRYRKNVYIGTDPATNKKKYKSVYGTSIAEVEVKEREVKALLGKGIDVSVAVESFSVWRDRWLKSRVTSVGASSYKSMQDRTKPMVEAFGGIPITKVQLYHVQGVIDDLAAKGQAKSTLQKSKIYTSQIFKLAIKNRVTDYNPVLDVDIPTNAPKATREALTEEQQRWVRETPHRAQTAAMIMMYAGLRRGELIPLRWSDIDLDAKTIDINKSVEMVNDKPVVKPGAKTDAGTRVIDIPQVLADYLRPLKPEQTRKVVQLDALVCPSSTGSMLSKSAWRRLWGSYMDDLNIKYGYGGDRSKFDPHRNGSKPIVMLIQPFTAHQLRHTFATLLYMAGVDAMTAKQQLGHADITTTLSIYTHLDKKHKRRAMDKLDEYLSPKEVQKTV